MRDNLKTGCNSNKKNASEPHIFNANYLRLLNKLLVKNCFHKFIHLQINLFWKSCWCNCCFFTTRWWSFYFSFALFCFYFHYWLLPGWKSSIQRRDAWRAEIYAIKTWFIQKLPFQWCLDVLQNYISIANMLHIPK